MLSSAARRLRLARPHLSSAARYATGAGDAPHSSPAPTSSDEFGPDGYPIGEFDPVLSEINGRYTVKPQPSKAASEVPAASARDEAELSVSEQQEDPASRRKKWQELYGKVGGALDPSKWSSEVAAPPDSMAKAAIESTVSRMAELAEGVSSEEPMGLSLTDEQRIRFDRVTSGWRATVENRARKGETSWSDLQRAQQKAWIKQWVEENGLPPTDVDRNTKLAKAEHERRQIRSRTTIAAAQANLLRIESGWIPRAVLKVGRVPSSTSSTDAPPPASGPVPSTSSESPTSSSPTRSTRHRPPHLPSPSEPRVADSRRNTPSLDSYPHAVNTNVLKAAMTPLKPSLPCPPIATLAHGLDRVLFNPGVHFLRDPRSGVYNFSPTLENVPKLDNFEFSKLPAYVTASKDAPLMELAADAGKKFVGSTSTTVGMLCQIYLWLSSFKPVNTSMLSAEWGTEAKTFSMGQRLPVSIIMHFKNGRYAIDSDKSIDLTSDSNVLGEYGHLMEKLLTTEPAVFERFLKSSADPARSEADDRQAYHYLSTEHMVLRSQLDAENEHLPKRTFDVKTRGSVAVRQDRQNWEAAAGYSISTLRGTWGSFEREYYDLIRSAFLKYQFQARIGGMDGVIVAYHSTSKFFGFQYCPISEMDEALFGGSGNNIFRTCVGMMEKILLETTAADPDHSLELTFAAEPDVLRVFVQKHLPDVDADARPSPTMYEFRATSYHAALDKTMVPFEFGTPNGHESWSTGFAFEKHAGDGDRPTRDLIKMRIKAVRDVQQMFNRILLPDGVKEADVVEAATRARESGVELDPSDLSVRFPFKEGLSYTSKPSYIVNHLRRLASRGNKKEPRRESIVRLRTVVEVQKL